MEAATKKEAKLLDGMIPKDGHRGECWRIYVYSNGIRIQYKLHDYFHIVKENTGPDGPGLCDRAMLGSLKRKGLIKRFVRSRNRWLFERTGKLESGRIAGEIEIWIPSRQGRLEGLAWRIKHPD